MDFKGLRADAKKHGIDFIQLKADLEWRFEGVEPPDIIGRIGDVDLRRFPPTLRDKAYKDLEARDILGFLSTADNTQSLYIVVDNLVALRVRGLFEQALLHAWTATRTNNRNWSTARIRHLFTIANRAKLHTAGDPLPGPGPFTLYRGVAGRGAARRIKGISWTACFERAKWFAERYSLPDPAVFTVQAKVRDVLAYMNDRNEEEFLVLLPRHVKPRRVKFTGSS